MKKKKIIILGIILLFIIIITILIIINSEKEKIIEYTPAEEILETDLNSTIITLYFKNKESNILSPEPRKLDTLLLIENPYDTIISILLEGPKNMGLEKTIPEGTKLNKTELIDEILFIDLSGEFIENHAGGIEEEKITIDCLVNTITELKEINGIKILINGEENLGFKDGALNFETIFFKKTS